ncbi:30S ribosomal protein S4 [Candidatus Pacearchaeota archaeon]|nr:30S ribosomal protein S4 [Candidatus Pacearchaeota archaeon]
MKRKHKIYSRPKRPFDKERIEEEMAIKKEFGLKNKKEVWKAEARIKGIREKAKKLISAGPEEQKALFNRLKKMGFAVNSIGDILALEKEDYLNRRLQTILVHKKLATTSKSARQLITHKHVLINGEVVNTPSYIVPVIFEDKISLKSHKVGKKESKKEEENKEQDEAHTVKEITNRLQNE